MRRAAFQHVVRVIAASCALLVPVAALVIFVILLPSIERELAQIPEAKDRIASQNELFKTILQIAGGSVLITGFYFTWKTIRVTQEGQITDRFNKAVDHLGQANMSIRLGGIYALARIAADSEKDASTVTQILTAYIREATASSSLPSPAQDVKSILDMLGAAPWAQETLKDISQSQLQGLELKHADLRGWNLTNVSLRETNLEHSCLDGATLAGANLSNAYLRDCSFKSANLTAADFTGAVLRHADLQEASIFGANFDGASLLQANFRGATGAIRQQFETAIIDSTTHFPEFKTDLD